ncbi:PqqD family protein [Bacteroides xylanisolvens]|nr:PqqD family protein [Bacteroides xylanisolvens]
MISREAKEVDEIIEHLSQIYDDSVTKEKLRNDFLKFILDLEKHLFLITWFNSGRM